MPQGNRTVSIVISAAIFILLEIAALAMLSSSSTLQNIWINRASHRVMAVLWGGGEKIRNHFRLEKQNEDLSLENAKLREELKKYKAREEREKEEEEAYSAESDKFNFIPASIVKISRNSSHNYVILNKGYEDGVKEQSGIISPRGVLGIVSAVGRNHSYGLSLMNNNISLSVRVGKIGVVAPLVWDGKKSNGALVNNVPPHHEVAPGDTIWTSGHSSIFPPDIAIGTTGKTRLMDGSTLQIEVELFQDFNDARYVTIVENTAKTEIEELENSEKDMR